MLKRWAALPRGIQWLTAIAVVVLALAIVWALFVPLADWLARHDVGSVGGSLHETALDNARGRLLTLGAGLFAAGALVYTARNFTLSREGQVTDRYTKAIEQLGSDKPDVRIGGVYALERIARDSARDHPTVMEVLTAFIREHSHEQWPPSGDPAGQERERTTRPDVQAALTVVGRRDPDNDIRSIDLAGADLARANLVSADLGRADLASTDLTRANLASADLSGANLGGAILTGAIFSGANLGGAFLVGADLADAALNGAKLNGANLGGANLADAFLLAADLSHADLAGAKLNDANLSRANLSEALLFGADLTRADLTGADLTRADLAGTDLAGTDLTHLTGADRVYAERLAVLARRAPGTNFGGAILTDTHLTGANLGGTRWPADMPIPDGWRLDPGSGRLEQAGSGSTPNKAD